MAITYEGNVSVAATVPGLKILSDALENLRSIVLTQNDILKNVHKSITIAALVDLEVQIEASLKISGFLTASLQDPTAYLAALAQGVAQLTANLNLLLPVVALQGQLSANAFVAAELTAKKAAIKAVIDGILAIHAALQAVLVATVNLALALFDNAGIHYFFYDGPLSGLGSAADANIPTQSGISPATNVRVPILVLEESNTVTVAALQQLLKRA